MSERNKSDDEHLLRGTMNSTASLVAAAQDRLVLRRIQHSQLQNALIRHKTERFLALKALRRSVELRRQISLAKACASSVAGGDVGGEVSKSILGIPAPPLDPSVKALIDKLTEMVDILPRYSEDQPGRERAWHDGWGERNEQRNATRGHPSREYAIEGKSSLVDTTTSSLVGGTGVIEDNDGLVVDEMDAVVGSSHDDPSAPFVEECIDPANEEEGDILGEQLRNLDSNMKTVFQDLDKSARIDSNKELESHQKEEAEKKRKEEEHRQRERAALLAQLEGLSGGGQTKLPRWRWIEKGVHDPQPDIVLQGRHLWKAAVWLIVVFFVRPRRALMQRKARSKDRDMQDWNTTLTIYFDRCQTWLLKTARIPVGNSLLKSSTLSFRLNHMDGKRDAYGAAASGDGKTRGGFVSSLVRKVARGIRHENLALTLMRLKVHAKGVMNGLTQEMPPSDIMTFFSYLAADGNYFPEGFFFEEETAMLSFDDLGAVRNLTPSTTPPDSFDDTLYALHASKDLEEELEADKEGHHEGFLDAHHLRWLVDAGHSLLEGTKAGITGHSATPDRPTDLRAAILHGRERLPGKLRPIYRNETNSHWFDTSFVEMILTNYLMVRLLIPWILLYPRESGLVPSSGLKQSVFTHNCQVLASTVYLIVRVLRPELTPPNADTVNAAIAEEIERATKIAAREEGDNGSGGGAIKSDDDNSSDDDSVQGTARGRRINSPSAAAEGAAEDPKGEPEGAQEKKGGPRKKLAALRRGSRVGVVPVAKPRTLPDIMRQKRYISISDKQLIAGLLPDAYFLPLVEQMRPWVLTLAAEFDSWMQKVVAAVMSKVECSVIRQDRAPKGEPRD